MRQNKLVLELPLSDHSDKNNKYGKSVPMSEAVAMTTDRVVLRPLKLVSGMNGEKGRCKLEMPRILRSKQSPRDVLVRVWKTSMLTEMQTAEAQPWVSQGDDSVESSARGLSSQNLAECCFVVRTSVRLEFKSNAQNFFWQKFQDS